MLLPKAPEGTLICRPRRTLNLRLRKPPKTDSSYDIYAKSGNITPLLAPAIELRQTGVTIGSDQPGTRPICITFLLRSVFTGS